MRIYRLTLLLVTMVSFFPAAALADAPPDFLLMWGSYGTGGGMFRGVAGVTVDENGYVYTTETVNGRIQKFDPDGNYVAQFGSLYQPHGISSNKNGLIYALDSGNHRIRVYTTGGTFVQNMGSGQGSGNGQFNAPRGIAVDPNGFIYVADTFNNRVQKLTTVGAYVTSWGNFGSANGQFQYPGAIAVDNAGKVFVADTDNDRVQVFDDTGGFLYAFGSNGSGDGELDSVLGIAVDASGVYVTDSNNSRVQKFTKAGLYLTRWGTAGPGPGQFQTDRGIAVNNAGQVYVADFGNDRVQKFGFGLVAENLLIMGGGQGLPALGPITIPITLSSLEPASGLEFEIVDTPDWFHVTGVATTGRASAMSASHVDGPGGLHVLMYSATGEQIAIGSGPVLRVTGTIDAGAVVGDSTSLAVTTVLMADAEGNPTDIDSRNGILHVDRIPGDVNGDNLLDAGDVVRLVEIVLGTGTPPTSDALDAADCNQDLAINLFDVTCLVNLILGGSSAPQPPTGLLAEGLPMDFELSILSEVKAIQFTLPGDTHVEAASELAPFVLQSGATRSGDRIYLAFDPGGRVWTSGSRVPFRTASTPENLRAFGEGGRPLKVETESNGAVIGRQGILGLTILAARPNPVRDKTTIHFTLPERGPVRLSVLDVRGALVFRSEARTLDAGDQTWVWSPLGKGDRRFPAGIYFAVIEAGGKRAPVRLAVLSP